MNTRLSRQYVAPQNAFPRGHKFVTGSYDTQLFYGCIDTTQANDLEADPDREEYSRALNMRLQVWWSIPAYFPLDEPFTQMQMF